MPDIITPEERALIDGHRMTNRAKAAQARRYRVRKSIARNIPVSQIARSEGVSTVTIWKDRKTWSGAYERI